MEEKKKSNKPLIITIIILSVVLVAVLVVGGILFVKNKNAAADNNTVEETEDDDEDDKPAKKRKHDKGDKDNNGDKDNTDKPQAVKVENPVADKDVLYSGSKKGNDVETATLIQYLLDNGNGITADDIVSATVDDFDDNGTYEAFVFVGKEIVYDEESGEGSGDYEGYICYTNGEYIETFDESQTGVWGGIDGILSFDGRKYAYASERYVTDYLSRVWSVYDGKAKYCEIDGLGSIYQVNDTEVYITDSNYDTVYDSEIGMMSGHSWKPYYFYYDKQKDMICEYGGAYICKEDIDDISGTNLIDQIEADEHEITSAFYRENGIMNVNYRDLDEKGDVTFGNVNYDCVAKEFVNAWGENPGDLYSSDYAGIYVSTYSDLFATYPNVTKQTEDVDLTVSSYNNVIASRGSVTLSGRNEDGDWISIVVDKDTKMAPNDASLFNDREDDMTAVEWLETLIQIEQESDWGTMKVEGVYRMTVTNGHADFIEGLYWWD